MPPDREAILARRALFVASALAGLTAPSKADEPEACPPPEPPSAADKEAAKALYQEAVRALDSDGPARAVELLRKAYELSRVVKLLAPLAQAERRAGDFAAAHAHLSELVRCADSPATLRLAEVELAQLEAETATITIEGGALGAGVEIDGSRVGTLPLPKALRLGPGRHEIALVGGACGETRRVVELAPGVAQVVHFEPDCEPRVCLQPCLSPPPPPPPDALPRFALGAGTLGYVGTRRPPGSEPGIAAGARVEALYVAPLGEAFALGLGVAALPAGSSEGALLPVGADVAFVAAPGALRLGLGVTGGWMFAAAERSEDDTWRPRSSLFVHPYLQPVGMRASDHVEVGLHVGLLLGTWATATEESFRPGFVTTSLWVRVYLGERKRAWEDVASR